MVLLHAVYYIWLASVIARGSQSTACGIEMRRGKPKIGLNCIFRKIIYSTNEWIFSWLQKYLFK